MIKVISDIDTNVAEDGLCAAVGFFDGLHRGHRKIIELCRGEYPLAVISFENQPAAFINSQSTAHKLMSNAEKEKLLGEMGVEYLFSYLFDEKMRNTSAEEFFEKAIVKNNVKRLACGFNFRFGKGGCGDTELLRKLCEEYGITLLIGDAETEDGEVISSTLIKKYLYKGDAKKASQLLGRDFYITGIVAEGKKLGRTLGFPTANVYVPSEIVVPKWGVYESYTTVGGVRYPSVTNIGNNPTIGEDIRVESHIIGFDGDIYGEEIKIEFHDYIRGEMKFSGIEELAAQVHKDIDTVKERNGIV
ncbi:MAG: bifunctional riboflavin kinase/FAD synthetase [Eubacteriaceae bacterium]|nr:bifunctional riboflavin kinase/FAD synthetase [Eubacteriaceae bacterium]